MEPFRPLPDGLVVMVLSHNCVISDDMNEISD